MNPALSSTLLDMKNLTDGMKFRIISITELHSAGETT